MNWLNPNYTGNPLISHQHPLARHHSFVDSSYRSHLQKAILCNMGDNKANLIHMGGKHKLRFGPFSALLEHQQIS